MTNDYVEELYGNFSKDIAKKDRNGLRRSLESCDNAKYESLKKFVPEKKNPLTTFSGLCVFIAMVVGGAFLAINAVLCGLLLPASKTVGYDIFTMITLVFDCILAVILFCYFAAYIPIRVMETGKKNLQAINGIINN